MAKTKITSILLPLVVVLFIGNVQTTAAVDIDQPDFEQVIVIDNQEIAEFVPPVLVDMNIAEYEAPVSVDRHSDADRLRVPSSLKGDTDYQRISKIIVQHSAMTHLHESGLYLARSSLHRSNSIA